jgi:adenylyltransferase/sulfurtransferase
MIDATDNVETRRVLNRLSVEKGLPFVFGGVKAFQGMITTFVPGETPCFECIFGHMEVGPEKVGVVGPVPGVIASLQVLEVVKMILGLEGLLKGRLLLFSGLDMNFREMAIERNPECCICGSNQERGWKK